MFVQLEYTLIIHHGTAGRRFIIAKVQLTALTLPFPSIYKAPPPEAAV